MTKFIVGKKYKHCGDHNPTIYTVLYVAFDGSAHVSYEYEVDQGVGTHTLLLRSHFNMEEVKEKKIVTHYVFWYKDYINGRVDSAIWKTEKAGIDYYTDNEVLRIDPITLEYEVNQ